MKLNKIFSTNVFAKTLVSGVVFLFITLSAVAQSSEIPKTAGEAGVFSNALFLSLLGVILLLLIMISVLGGVLKNVAGYYAKNGNAKRSAPLAVLLPLLMLVSTSSYSQGNSAEVYSSVGGLNSMTFNVLVGIILLELLVITILIVSVNTIIRTVRPVEELPKVAEQPSFLERMNASVAIEKEEEIMFDHEYDGIRELDNDLPPWWKYGFYVTVVFSFIYLVHYHVTKTGDLQLGELKKEIALADQKMEEYRKKAANLVDETNVKMLKGGDDLAKGKEIYLGNCAACHGKLGEGGVGPNMTDEYWIHGGSIKDLFKTIKYGYPEKGMKSWEAELSPLQISQVASFLETLVGSNPPNAKEKQGVLYVEEAGVDSAHAVIQEPVKDTATSSAVSNN